jgi:hypothetical protein
MSTVTRGCSFLNMEIVATEFIQAVFVFCEEIIVDECGQEAVGPSGSICDLQRIGYGGAC